MLRLKNKLLKFYMNLLVQAQMVIIVAKTTILNFLMTKSHKNQEIAKIIQKWFIWNSSVQTI